MAINARVREILMKLDRLSQQSCTCDPDIEQSAGDCISGQASASLEVLVETAEEQWEWMQYILKNAKTPLASQRRRQPKVIPFEPRLKLRQDDATWHE